MKKIFLTLAILVNFTGCATYSNWKPVVDPRVDAQPANLQRDIVECKALAQEASQTITETLKGTVVGGAVGAAGGAATGALFFNPLTGAAIGSTVGIAGGLYSGVTADRDYKHAYTQCLRQRGHAPIN